MNSKFCFKFFLQCQLKSQANQFYVEGEKGANQSKLAREMSKKWGINVKRTTVKGIFSKKMQSCHQSYNSIKRHEAEAGSTLEARRRGAHMAEASKRTEYLPVSGNLIKEKALITGRVDAHPRFYRQRRLAGQFQEAPRHHIQDSAGRSCSGEFTIPS